MPTPQNETLRALMAAEQTALERLTHASSARVDEARRARALLAVARGRPFAQAARQAGFRSGSTIAGLVQRFNRHGLAALRIAPGRRRRPTYAPAARAQIVATAQRPPGRRTDGTATWLLSTLPHALRRKPAGRERDGYADPSRHDRDRRPAAARYHEWRDRGTGRPHRSRECGR